MPWGYWTGRMSCTGNNVFLKGARYKSEYNQGAGDDSAGNSVNMLCADDTVLKGNGGPWGSWSNMEKCPFNTVICGIWTKAEPYQGPGWILTGDDSAINEVHFACCKFKECP